jgi:hypothetical protein
MGRLGVIRIGAGGNAESGHRDAGDESDNHDFQMCGAIR